MNKPPDTHPVQTKSDPVRVSFSLAAGLVGHYATASCPTASSGGIPPSTLLPPLLMRCPSFVGTHYFRCAVLGD